jgi:hypothetical protein
VAQGKGPDFKSQYHKRKKEQQEQLWSCTPVIPKPGRLRQEDCEFEAKCNRKTLKVLE